MPEPYQVTTAEIGPVARALRESLNLNLKAAAGLVGVDASNLGKAEKGHLGYVAVAARAIERLAEECDRRSGRTNPQGYAVVALFDLPKVLTGFVDAVRATSHANERLQTLERLLSEHGITLRGYLRPYASLYAVRGGRHVIMNLDTLSASAIERVPNDIPPTFSTTRRLFFGRRPGDDDETHMPRLVEWISTYLKGAART